MEDIIRMLIEKDLLVVVIVGIIVILFLILFLVLIITDKKNKKENNSEKDDNIEILAIEKENTTSFDENIKKEEIEQEYLDEPKENISDIENMLASMKSSLEERNQKEIDSFEQEQEENAIISYQELVNACRKNKEKAVEESQKESPKIENIEKKEEPVKKFKNSEFISPIYGKEKKKDDSFEQFLSKNFENKEESLYIEPVDSSIETEFDLEELEKEMKEKEEFLEELKKFRNSL